MKEKYEVVKFKDNEIIELMELNEGNIRVGQYLTQMPPKKLLEKKLYSAIKNAKIQLEKE